MPFKDPEKRKAYQKKYQKKYYQENKDKCLDRQHEYYQETKEERDEKTNKYRETHPWLRHFVNAKQRCENPNCPAYKYYGARGVKFQLTMTELKKLWFKDKAYLLKRPSLDRNDGKKNYTYDNCQFMELNVNTRKGGRAD